MEIIGIKTNRDIQSAINLLDEGFMENKEYWSSAFLRRLNKTENYGFLLKTNNEPIGVLITFTKNLNVNGDNLKLINLSSWYVQEKYRVFASHLLMKVIEENKDKAIITSFRTHKNFTPIFLKLGFELFSEYDLFLPTIFTNFFKLNDFYISEFTRENKDLLNDNDKKKSEDHDGEDFLKFVYKEKGREKMNLIIFKIEKRKGLKVLKFMYATRLYNFDNLIQALKARVLSLGFLIISFPNIYPYNTSFFKIKDPTSCPILLKPTNLNWKVNKLYSEECYLGRI
mgnify:CR=1 FL=1